MRFLLSISLGLILLSACKDNKVDEVGQKYQENFFLKAEYGIYLQGNAVFVYQKGVNQLVFAADGLHCRVQTDNLDKYVAIELAEKPVVGQMVKARMKAKSIQGICSGEQFCRVLRNEGGKCWLWEPDSAVGYLIRIGE